jgi:2-hydroxymuconate-semialdehyde hydrolase
MPEMNRETANGSALDKLHHFVGQEILEGQAPDLAPETPLLELGILNSMEVIALVSFIERTFGVAVPPDQIVPANFRNLLSIARFVDSLRAG